MIELVDLWSCLTWYLEARLRAGSGELGEGWWEEGQCGGVTNRTNPSLQG